MPEVFANLIGDGFVADGEFLALHSERRSVSRFKTRDVRQGDMEVIRNTHLLFASLAFTLFDDLDELFLDSLLERTRDLVGTFELIELIELLGLPGPLV